MFSLKKVDLIVVDVGLHFRDIGAACCGESCVFRNLSKNGAGGR